MVLMEEGLMLKHMGVPLLWGRTPFVFFFGGILIRLFRLQGSHDNRWWGWW